MRLALKATIFYYLHNTLEAARAGEWKLHVAKPRVSRDDEELTRDSSAVPKPRVDDSVEVRELYHLAVDPSETHNVYDEYPDIVEAIMKEIRRCREDIGDALTHTAGKNVRAIGYAENPKPLTEYKEDYPYLVAMYDKTEVG